MDSTSLVKVKTSDEVTFDCSIDTLNKIGYFLNFLEGRDSVDEVLDMTALNITEVIMKEVLEFTDLLAKYKTPMISKPIKHGSIYEVTSPVFAAYADKFDDERLCEMIMAADRL